MHICIRLGDIRIDALLFEFAVLGSFFGSWGGGRLYDLQGNYDTMWWIAIALGLTAGVVDALLIGKDWAAGLRSALLGLLVIISTIGIAMQAFTARRVAVAGDEPGAGSILNAYPESPSWK